MHRLIFVMTELFARATASQSAFHGLCSPSFSKPCPLLALRLTPDGTYTLKKWVMVDGKRVPTTSAHPGTSAAPSLPRCVSSAPPTPAMLTPMLSRLFRSHSSLLAR
jgi:hypothetical protein